MVGEAVFSSRGSRTFPRQYRLIRTDEFSSVFGFKRVLRSPRFCLHYLPKGEGAARLGLVVGKRFAPLATRRNLVKRIAREAFRHCHGNLASIDLILRLNAKLGPEPDRRALAEELRGLLDKLARLAKQRGGA